MSRSLPQLRIAILLGIACAIATALVFPYLLAVRPDMLATARGSRGTLIAVGSLQTGAACFLLGWIGLKLGAPLGLGAPWLAALMYGRERPDASGWVCAIVLGAIAACIILAAVALFGTPIASSPTVHEPVAWKGLLASPYGAVVEETELRVFMMGGLAWLLARAGDIPRAWRMGIAIITASVLFGVGHLPLAAQIAPLTAALVARVIAYNALGGLAFGWLYWKHGLEHAMLAHFCADFVLHVGTPLAMA